MLPFQDHPDPPEPVSKNVFYGLGCPEIWLIKCWLRYDETSVKAVDPYSATFSPIPQLCGDAAEEVVGGMHRSVWQSEKGIEKDRTPNN